MTRPTFRLRVLVLLAELIAPALIRADAPSNVPQFCSAQTQKCTSCHGDVANECVLLSLDLGETTPWTGSMPVHLKVRTSEASPSLYCATFVVEALQSALDEYSDLSPNWDRRWWISYLNFDFDKTAQRPEEVRRLLGTIAGCSQIFKNDTWKGTSGTEEEK